jgi:hypothetical protein
MRSCRTYGSVRGVPGNWHPYRDSLEQPENIRLDPHYGSWPLLVMTFPSVIQRVY